jgi:hypothetical protein
MGKKQEGGSVNTKGKLWVAYWVMGATTVFLMFAGADFLIVEGAAIVGASFGWAAFLRSD